MRDLFVDISKVNELVGAVSSAPANDINALLDVQMQLSVYGYYIAEHLGELYELYCAREVARKIDFGKYMSETTEPIGKAREMFYVDSDRYSKEKQAEVNYKRIKLLLDQVNQTLQVLSVKISCLKKELENSKKM
jgi:hypothetical protein